MFYLTSRDAKTVRVRHGGRKNSSDRYFHQEHFATNQKYLVAVTQSRHEALESPCEVSYESVTY